MALDPNRGHQALRRGRVSIPHAEYFLTICTDQRRVGLTSPLVAEVIQSELRGMDADKAWQLRSAVVMPDHVHVLAVLGERLPLGKCIARFKAKTAARLRAAGLAWERDFFDHHVRPDEDRLSLFLYLYLNPYRAELCERTAPWRWHFCAETDWAWFKSYLESDRPAPEWLR